MNTIDIKQLEKSEAFCAWLGIRPGDEVGFELMGHGEYNLNYIFRQPHTGEKLVLRIPMGSQMHLRNQIRYEYDSLRLLEPTGRTPAPLYIDDTNTVIPNGFLVMSFLPGRALRYDADLEQAARCLAEIHNLDIPKTSHLLAPQDPLAAILDECNEMFNHYQSSDLAEPDITRLISSLLSSGQKILKRAKSAGARCIINTELNSGNFLVSDNTAYLVDWEKPLYAYLFQDLGHFLAPTTTFWKTDAILTECEIQKFMQCYCGNSTRYSDPSELWDETLPYFTMNCLRGVSWCSMALVEYQSQERALRDSFAFEKIKTYVSLEFLNLIRDRYM